MKTNSKKKIVIVGSSNTDMVVRCEHMPRPGETVLGGEFMMNPGGKGANQAVAVSRLGGEAVFIGKVGDDIFGIQTRAQLSREGIDVRHLGTASDCASGVALINVDAEGENSISVASGANGRLTPEDISAAAGAICSADILLMQLEVPVETVTFAACMAKSHGVKVVLNPAPAMPLPPELLKHVDILIPNRSELELIAGCDCSRSVDEAVRTVSALGVSTLIVTLGSKGAMICSDGQSRLVPPFPVKAVDTTAAGDTFCGALCVALAEGRTIDEAVTFGNKAASVTVTRPGAQCAIPTRSEIGI